MTYTLKMQALMDAKPVLASSKEMRTALAHVNREVDSSSASQSRHADQINVSTTAYAQLGKQARRTVDAVQSITAVSGNGSRGEDIKAYGRELDNLRARYNPLFAVTQRYLQIRSEIRSAHAKGAISTKEMTAAIGRERAATLAAIASAKGRVSSIKQVAAAQITGAVQAAGAVRLNNQQLLNMQYQLNDIGVMMASGQSPFVMLMQQGMQISQMFQPGTGVLGALGAVGAGLRTFLTNPINLAVVAIASLAGGAALLWDVFSGSEAKSAEDLLESLNTQIDQLAKRTPEAAEEIRKLLNAGESETVLLAGFKATNSELEAGLMRSLENLVPLTKGFITEWGNVKPEVLSTQNQIRALGDQLNSGEITAKEFREQIAAMRIDPALPSSMRETVDRLLDASVEARNLEAGLDANTTAASRLQKEVARVVETFSLIDNIDLSFRLNPDNFDKIKDQLKAQSDEIMRPILEAQRKAEQEANKASRLREREDRKALNASKRLERQQQRLDDRYDGLILSQQQRVDGLKLEADTVGLASGEVARLRTQQQLLNQATRAGIDLGPDRIAEIQRWADATGAATQRLEEQRTAQQAANDNIKFWRDGTRSGIDDIRTALKDGEVSWKEWGDAASNQLDRIIDKMLDELADAIFQTGSKGKGGILDFFAGLFPTTPATPINIIPRAIGGDVVPGYPHIVGERGREIIYPKSPATVIPNDKITIAKSVSVSSGPPMPSPSNVNQPVAERPIVFKQYNLPGQRTKATSERGSDGTDIVTLVTEQVDGNIADGRHDDSLNSRYPGMPRRRVKRG